MPCSKRKKKEGMSEGEAKAVVEGLLAMMEVAVGEDHKQYEQGAGCCTACYFVHRVVNGR